jgi:Chaperone of endosialidase
LGLRGPGNLVVEVNDLQMLGDFNRGDGCTGRAFRFNSPSWDVTLDLRLLQDVADYPVGLDAVRRLRPVTYRLKGRARSSTRIIGMVADEVETIMPEMVGVCRSRLDFDDPEAPEHDDVKTLNIGPLHFALINAVKELTARRGARFAIECGEGWIGGHRLGAIKQLTLVTVGFERYVRRTRRTAFLEEMRSDVAAGRIPAGIWVTKACARFRSDLTKAKRGEGRWAFEPAFAIRPILLAGQLVNVKGPEAGQPIRLLLRWSRLFGQLSGRNKLKA